jgi:CRP-like cAMP-binding protein
VLLDTDETDGIKVLDELGAGDSFGEGSLVTGQPHTYTAFASGRTELLILEREVFLTVLQTQKQVLHRVGRTLFERQLGRTKSSTCG